MKRTQTVIVGAGQAGLAMSRCLTDLGIDHVLFERGRVAERWRTERWESLRLLTPNWQSRLPGYRYDGPDPDGYMSMPEVIAFLEGYASSFDAPVESETTVLDVRPGRYGLRVTTDRGVWKVRTVVIATGYCDVPFVPGIAGHLHSDIHHVTPAGYRRAGELPPGGVLVVGASASGVQLADEIHASGRPVIIAAGSHTRVPRVYRGRDIMWWLDASGILHETIDEVYDPAISRDQVSLQLVGRGDRSTLDLLALRNRGVRVVGRVVGADGYRVALADDLVATTVAADVKLAALLERLNRFAAKTGLDLRDHAPEPFEPTWPAFTESPVALDLRAEGIRTVVWATGFKRRYPWLPAAVLDERGEIRHRGGVSCLPGLYGVGLNFMRRRNSAFIDGVGADARAVAAHIDQYLRQRAAPAVA